MTSGEAKHLSNALGFPLVSTESDLRPPPPRSGFVLRHRLLDAVKETEADVFTFVAPTGYGKTSILTQWVKEEMAPMGWLTLSREHNRANIFLSRLAASLKRTGVTTADDVALFQFMGESEAVEHGAAIFAGIVEESGVKPLLIVDRLESLRRRAVTDVVAELVNRLDGAARIAIGSHSEPKIRLPAVRASGRLLEFTEEDLAFTIEEVERLLVGLGLDPTVANEVLDSTQGWPIAVFLTAIAIRDGRSPSVNVRIEGERHLKEFVRSEIVPHLSRQRRQFLTLMSPLERMSGPLCDAVATTTGSGRLLESLQSNTHLVSHVDHEANWFAMNRVLRDVLCNELETNAPEAARDVHARASAWFEANDLPTQAIRHAQSAGDIASFARLLESLIKGLYTTGHVAEVLDWMHWLQESVELDRYPGLAAIGALVHLQEGNLLETERWLESASRSAADNDARSVIGIVRASLINAGVEQMARDIETTLETADPGSTWLPAILVTRGLAHLMNGDSDQAEQSFAQVSKVALENQSLASYTLAQGHRALFAVERHDWESAQSLSDRAIAVIDEHGLDGYYASGPALIAAARCARRDNDINKAQNLLARASTVRPRLSLAMPGQSVSVLTEMARAHVELSDVAGARAMIREAEEILLQRPNLGVLAAQLGSVKESLATLGPGKVGLPALTKAELRVLPLLATHMSFPEIGDQLFVSRHTVKSQATSIYRKLGCSTRSEAIAKAYEIGLLSR